MADLNNILELYRKESMSQPLMSNPPYVGDQLENKKSKNKPTPSTIYFFKVTEHFIQRLIERNIDVAKVKDVIQNGKSKFQNVLSGTMEFVKDNIKVVADIFNKRLVTVFDMSKKEAALYDLVSDIENFVLADEHRDTRNRIMEMQDLQKKLQELFKDYLKAPRKETVKDLLKTMDHYKDIVEKVPFAPRIKDYKMKVDIS